MASSPLCIIVAVGAALLAGACKSESASAVRRDDVSAVTGQYERPEKGVYEIETATLIVTTDGMTFEDAPYRESMLFAGSACDTRPSGGASCKVTATLCEASLEKRADGNLVVTADKRCQSMAGLWYTSENARKVAAELASASPPPIASVPAARSSAQAQSAPTPAPTAQPRAGVASSASPSDSALSLLPDDVAPGADRSCLNRCTKIALSCAKSCKVADPVCLARCNSPTADCAACLGPR